jgi:hypothetical protein
VGSLCLSHAEQWFKELAMEDQNKQRLLTLKN